MTRLIHTSPGHSSTSRRLSASLEKAAAMQPYSGGTAIDPQGIPKHVGAPQPCEFCEGGQAELKKRLDDEELLPKLRAAISDRLKTYPRIHIASCKGKPAWSGKSLSALAKAEGQSIPNLVLDIQRGGGASVACFTTISIGVAPSNTNVPVSRKYATSSAASGAATP